MPSNLIILSVRVKNQEGQIPLYISPSPFIFCLYENSIFHLPYPMCMNTQYIPLCIIYPR